MLTMPTILMVFLAVMWFGFSEAGGAGRRHGGGHALRRGEHLRGHQGDGQVADRDGGDVQGATRSLLIRKVYLPQLMPYIFSAFRYAFGVTWKVVALAETFGLKYGIGYMFFFWFGQFNMVQVLAWVIMFVILMLILEHGVFAQLERRAFAWRTSLARS